MKSIFLAVLLVFFMLPQAFAIVGKTLPIELLPKTIIQGNTIESWEKDKLYVMECWATWCGPCRSAMHHIEMLWQTLKPKGHYVYGLNVMERQETSAVKQFLDSQPTKVTYPNLQVRERALLQYLKIQGIPFAFIVKNGEILWQGHPARLTASMLEDLIQGRVIDAKAQEPFVKSLPPLPKHLQYERLADEALLFNRWEKATQLQEQALRNHPLQAFLKTPYLPTITEMPENDALGFQGVDLEKLSEEGDLAPYAILLGAPLPKLDNEFTVLSYWRPDPTFSRYTSENDLLFPGHYEREVLRHPYRLKIVADRVYEKTARSLFASAPMLMPRVEFYDAIDSETLFGYNEQTKGPFVAIFLSGRLIYKGALQRLPEVLQASTRDIVQPMPTAEVWLQKIADENEHDRIMATRFQHYRNEKNETLAEKELTMLCEMVASARWEATLLPHRLKAFYERKDLAGAAAIVTALFERYPASEVVLNALSQTLSKWPELQKEMQHIHALIVARLVDVQCVTREERTRTCFYAAQIANAAGDTLAAEQYIKKAIEISPTGMRYRSILQRIKPVPAP